jgi:hypothetical protein
MGAHAGEAVLGGRDYTGLEVHRTARIAAAAGAARSWCPTWSAAWPALWEMASRCATWAHISLRDLPAPEPLFQVCARDLPVEFPPLRTTGLTTPTNLPAPVVTRFVGRQSQLAELGRLLKAQRLVTLTGPGGTGKSRLAIEAARRVAADFLTVSGSWRSTPVRDPAWSQPRLPSP